MEQKQIYAFLGLPASGKGTQAQIFAEKYGFDNIGIGDLVREEMATNKGNDEFILAIRERYSQGAPVSDDIIFKLLEKKLNSISSDGVVFDNFPFNKAQLEFLLKYAEQNNWQDPVVIYIKIDPEYAVKRISTRKICPKCKSVFTGGTTCEKCGAELVSRSDDNEETVRKRIQSYLPNIEEVVSTIKNHNGEVIEIDGEPPIETVTREIDQLCKIS